MERFLAVDVGLDLAGPDSLDDGENAGEEVVFLPGGFDVIVQPGANLEVGRGDVEGLGEHLSTKVEA